MTKFQRKDGEKATLLSQCGMSLFGCTGETKVTQGIYLPKAWSPEPHHCFCKRGVWVPTAPSKECLIQYLQSCDPSLPFSIDRISNIRGFGLCGLSATRTVHATDTQFFLLAKYPWKKFTVYGIVNIERAEINNPVTITTISTDMELILQCVGWIRKEAENYHQVKEKKRRGKHVEVPMQVSHDDETVEQCVPTPENAQFDERLFNLSGQEVSQQNVDSESEASVNQSEYSEPSPADYSFQQVYQDNSVYQFNTRFGPSLLSFEPLTATVPEPALIQQQMPTPSPFTYMMGVGDEFHPSLHPEVSDPFLIHP